MKKKLYRCTGRSCIICLHYPETYAYSMTFLPIFGNLPLMCALDCGTITFMSEKIAIPR